MKRLIFLLAFLPLLASAQVVAPMVITSVAAPPAGGSAPVRDVASTSGSAYANQLSWSHSGGSGSNRYAVVYASIQADATASSATYGGTSMTLLGSVDGGAYRITLFGLANPASGTQTVVVNYASEAQVAAHCVTATGVHQTTSTGTVATGTTGWGTSISANVTTTANDLVIDCVGYEVGGSSTLVVGANQTQESTHTANSIKTATSTETATGTSTTMSWTITGDNTLWLIAVPLKPA